MPENDADVQKIRELIEIMKENDLVKIDIQHGEDRLSLRRAEPERPAATPGHIITTVPSAIAPAALAGGQAVAAEESAEEKPCEDYVEVKSPIVGTFYEAPSPDADPYVQPGSHVEPQTVVCIIEAMKVMNEIKAETSGTIIETLAPNGQSVEYGQPLFRVKPD
jgi:acetyl-CoA carboxylase biotin carboxyl carrier protein